MKTATSLTAAVLLTSLVAGCAADPTSPSAATSPAGSAASEASPTTAPAVDEPTRSPAPPTGASPTTGSGPSGRPPFPTGTADQMSRRSAGRVPTVFTGVRTAHHPGFDRIVLEFAGTARPGWWVGYVDEPGLEGTGRVVRLRGRSTLSIQTHRNTWPSEDYYDGPLRIRTTDSGSVPEVYVGGTNEGYTLVYAGVAGAPAPFRVFTLLGPPRLVVDVAH